MYFYEVKIRGNEESATGAIKVRDYQYLIQGVSFGEVETKGFELAEPYMKDMAAKSIKLSNVAEIVGNGEYERWYKVKVKMIVFDPNKDKESTTNVLYLTNANSLTDAERLTKEYLGKEFEYDISDVSETKILDVVHATNE